MKKIKEYLKNKNPYLLASAAIVILSVGIIIALLQEKPAEVSEISEEIVPVESLEQLEEELQDTDMPTESERMDDAETDKKEESAKEDPETAEEATGSASNHSSEPGLSSDSEETPELIEEQEREAYPEESLEPTEKVVPENDPEAADEVPEEVVIPEPEVHEHSWIFESFYQEPTCSNGGLVTQICAHCGETQITGGIPTGEHSYEVETPGDCCSAEVVVCTECNHREVREKDPTNHIDVEDGFCYGCGHKTE